MPRKYGSQNYKKMDFIDLKITKEKKNWVKETIWKSDFWKSIFENKDEECKEWGIHMYFNNGPPKMATNGMQEYVPGAYEMVVESMGWVLVMVRPYTTVQDAYEQRAQQERWNHLIWSHFCFPFRLKTH